MTFQLTNAVGGEPIDLLPRITQASPVDACNAEGEPATGELCFGGNTYTATTTHATVINYRDETQSVNNMHWEVDWLGLCQETPCDDLLEVNETALITVWFYTQTDINNSGYSLAYVQETEGGDTDSLHLNGPAGEEDAVRRRGRASRRRRTPDRADHAGPAGHCDEL